MSSEQWYSNKELFEQMLSMKDDIQSLRAEMRETREIIRLYTGITTKSGTFLKWKGEY